MSLIQDTIFDGECFADSHRKRTDHMAYLPDMEILDSTVGAEVLARTRQYDPNRVTEEDVRRALSKKNREPEDFGALLSPAALPLLEEIAQEAIRETREHFGTSISMFTPRSRAKSSRMPSSSWFSEPERMRRVTSPP